MKLIRRLAPCLLVLMSATGLADAGTTQPSSLNVTANGTTYMGKLSDTQATVTEYLGIPFAMPPVGDMRWRAPAPMIKMPVEYNSQHFKPACYQLSYNIDWYKQVAELFGTQNLAMDMPRVSEDCLYLNIWKPNKKQLKQRPVMIWIHGGSNKAGWSYEPNYLGQELANTGNVIVVSIAYRLGVFGFLAHPEFTKQAAKTNFGILDQIAALEWIQKNIRYFGGNPNNITIFGESAGAANVGYLMSTAKAKTLFHQAISQSGGFHMMAGSRLEQAQTLGKKLSVHFNNSNVEQLRKLPANTVWQATEQLAPDYDFRALQDDQLFKQALPQAFASNANVNLMIGSNKNEYYMYLDDSIEQPQLALSPKDVSLREQLFNQFSSFEDPRVGQDWLDTFLYMACPSALMAQLVSNNDRQAWLYRFDRTRENGEMIKAYHGAEIPYVFDTHDAFLPTNNVDQDLTKSMMRAWTNFAHSGNPNETAESASHETTQAAINWRPYTQAHPEVLIFDRTIKHSQFEQHALCQQLWPEYLKR